MESQKAKFTPEQFYGIWFGRILYLGPNTTNQLSELPKQTNFMLQKPLIQFDYKSPN